MTTKYPAKKELEEIKTEATQVFQKSQIEMKRIVEEMQESFEKLDKDFQDK